MQRQPWTVTVMVFSYKYRKFYEKNESTAGTNLRNMATRMVYIRN